MEGEAAVSEGTASRLAHDLRRSVSAFVRTIRQDSGTVRSAQSEALDLLHRLGPMNVATLAEKRGVTHQTMRLVVAQLEATGSVKQQPDPADRRSRLVSISPAGRDAVLREQNARASRIEEAIRTRLSVDEQQMLRAAVPLLERLATPAVGDEGEEG